MRTALFIHLTAATLFSISGCAIGPGKERMEAAKQSEATGNPRPWTPSNEVEKIEVPKNSPVVVDALAGNQMLDNIATKGGCAGMVYGNQGKAPPGYLKGLVRTYVKLVCEKDQDVIAKSVYEIATASIGSSEKDALAHYGLVPKSPTDRLNSTFAMMIGSNARESSWRPCCGRDILAKESDVKECLNGVYNGVKYTGSGSTCEAGLAQTSYNSIANTGPLRDLFDSYLEYPRGCFETIYYGKTTCSEANWKNHGSDPKAVAFQRLSKTCPGFTVESGLIMFRTNRKHYGPINQKKAEVYSQCVSMFEEVRQAIIKQPTLCFVL